MSPRIDVHGHYTAAPLALDAYRGRQVGELNRQRRRPLTLSDDEITESLAENLRVMDERDVAVQLFSPRASGMGHDFGDALTSLYWTEVNNDLIHRVCTAYPTRFAGVCQLPQSPLAAPRDWLPELERCVNELGFLGCNVNPDISGGLQPFTPSLADTYWYPLWEKLVELEVPAMLHASATHNPAFHTNGSHYLAWDYTSVVELAGSRVFQDFPDLKLIVPHGGGGIPLHFNRHRALHIAEGKAPFEEAVRQLYFDTSLYDADGLEMLIRKIGPANVLFGAEIFGTARGDDPLTGRGFDDVGALLEELALPAAQSEDIAFRNALRLYPRLASTEAGRAVLGAASTDRKAAR
ncbi:amidohydrolase family protein [Streptomyces olivaceus]